jgi:hypothetical protein
MSELGDALELLHGAAGRVATLSATLLAWYDEERGMHAAEAAQQGAGDGSVAVLYHAGKGEPPPPRRYEQQTLVRYRHPGRYRLHRQATAHVHRSHDVLQVCDGEREWTYVAADREAYVQAAGQHELVRLLDPSWGWWRPAHSASPGAAPMKAARRLSWTAGRGPIPRPCTRTITWTGAPRSCTPWSTPRQGC